MSAKSSFRQVDGVIEQLCTGCQTFKPQTAEFFHRNRTKGTGLNSHCKTCQRVTCKRLTNERNAFKTAQGAAQLLAELWRGGKRSKLA